MQHVINAQKQHIHLKLKTKENNKNIKKPCWQRRARSKEIESQQQLIKF